MSARARIVLARHGATRFNREGRYQGAGPDPGLSPEGWAQARRVARRFAAERVAAVYSSDLPRALQTARVAGALLGVPVTAVPGLREISFGEWEGLSAAEIRERWGPLWDAWVRDPRSCRPPGGEDLDSMCSRVVGALRAIAAAHPGGVVGVVSHGGPIRAALCGLSTDRGGGFWDFAVEPGSIAVIDA